MGGKSSSSSTTTNNPYAPVAPTLQGLGAAYNALTPQATAPLNSIEQGAISGIQANAGSNPFAQPGMDNVASLMAGGGMQPFGDTAKQINTTYQNQLSPYLDPNYTDPMTNPAMKGMLDMIQNNATTAANAQFAGAGRGSVDQSGGGMKALGQGIAYGELPALLGQYNTNVGVQRGAQDASGAFAGNANAFGSNIQQAINANKNQGLTSAPTALQNRDAAYNQMLYGQSLPLNYELSKAEALQQPAQALGQAFPTSTTNTTQQASPMQEAMGWTSALSKLFGTPWGAGASAPAALSWSDERLKEDIAPVGKLADGKNVYAFRYKGDATPRIGLMAQEVMKTNPGAVKRINGFLAVDYKKATAPSRGLLAGLQKAA